MACGGGINPHGEIEMKFFTMNPMPYPRLLERIVAPRTGSLGHEVVEEDSDLRHINRHIRTRLFAELQRPAQ